MRAKPAARVFGCSAVLLAYPDESLAEDLTAAAAAIGRLPAGRARASLSRATGWLSSLPPGEAASIYVDTFDLRRGTSLYLTWYRHGDTRERGMALAALTDTYHRAGYQVAPGELPDFLPALLELAAVHPSGAALLGEHRLALDALRLALETADSGYVPIVSAVLDALPPPSRSDRDALARFRAQGPPTEQVGLEPYGPPELLGQKGSRR